MTDRLDEHLRRLRALGRPPGYSLADKPIYNWLHDHGDEPPLSWPVLSIYDIVGTMPVGVQVGATPLRLSNYIIPTFLRRVGFARYPQIVRLLNGKRLRLWVRSTVDTSHGYNVADAYEKVRDIQLPQPEPERDVWDI